MAVLDENILDKRTTLVAIFPSPMSYAGPKEGKLCNIKHMNYFLFLSIRLEIFFK